MPATDNVKEQQLTAGDDVMLTIGAHTKHYTEAREFVDFLMSEENVKDYSKQQSAFTPYKDTYVGDEALNGVLDFYKPASWLISVTTTCRQASTSPVSCRRWCSRAILNDS